MEPDEHNQRRRKKRRVSLVLLALATCLGAAVFLGVRSFLPTHPLFGAIYQATAFDVSEARFNRLGVFLRKHLPRRVVHSPYFPSRFKNQPRYLRVGDSQLEWSIGGTG